MMWSDWRSVPVVGDEPPSVLGRFPRMEAKQIVSSVLRSVSGLEEEAELCWSLEVLRFGLRLAPCDGTVTACAQLYSDWMTVLLPEPSPTVPQAVRRDPNHLGRMMLRHLPGLFTNVNLDPSGADSALESVCLNVLAVLETVGQQCSHLDPQTVTCLLEVLLASSDLVLSQPGPSTPLSHSLVSVLCHCWLAACALSSFPSPGLWSSLVVTVRGWRHRLELVAHWAELNTTLLSLHLSPPALQPSPCYTLASLSRERLVQISFRFLHLLGNIVELTQEKTISRSPGLVRAAQTRPEIVSASLQSLPDIFLTAVSLLSRMVDGYLGISSRPPAQSLSPKRPSVSTMLHMLGPWLYQAALLDTPYCGLEDQDTSRYSAGRAEAIRTLCILFNSKRFSEEIEEAYLARFYLAIEFGLKAGFDVQFSTLQYFGDLMARNLPGANILLPQLITSLLRSLRTGTVEQGRCVVHILKSVHCFPLHFREMSPVRFIKTDPTIHLAEFIEDIFQSLIQYLQKETNLSNCQDILSILASYMESSSDSWSPWSASLTSLICLRLGSTDWSSDYSTCLVALEILIFLSSSSTQSALSEVAASSVLSSLCKFVVLQCSKPPPAHSKDLHSSIILAFQTVARWLLSHPALLTHSECLGWILQIIELAISGCRSEKTTDYKEDKKPSPVSQRVSRAAEELLCSVMTKVGYSPLTSLSEKCSTSLSEESVRALDPWAPPSENFKYYFCDQSYILAISKAVAEEEHCRNTTIAIFRSPAGKTFWRFSQSPHSHQSNNRTVPVKATKKIDNSRVVVRTQSLQNFPPVETPRPCRIDSTIPGLSDLANDDEMERLIAAQQESEGSAGVRASTVPASQPASHSSHQNWRMLMSQLGLVEQMLADEADHCLELDSSSPDFWQDLKSLDNLKTRTVQTLCVYYVKQGQHKVSDILANNLSSSLPPAYLRLLSSLGWQVEVASHRGWDGNVKSDTSHILYWADDLDELAILVPCQPIFETFPNCDLSPHSSASRLRTEASQKVLLVWLESPEDRAKFPHRLLVTDTDSVSLIIYISPLECGLVRVELTSGEDKVRNVAPLMNGLVTSQCGLGNLVRQTGLNVCRRERLEADTSQQCPALVRRSAINNFRNKYVINNNNTAGNIQSLFI